MLGAIGTLSATVLALIFGYRSYTEQQQNRPKLKIEYNETELMVINDAFHQFLLRIKNNGSTTALNTNIKIVEVVQDKNNLIKPFENNTLLCNERIQCGDYINFNTLFLPKNGGVEIFYKYGTQEGRRGYERKDISIKLLITGDNFPAFTKLYKLSNISNLSKISLTELYK